MPRTDIPFNIPLQTGNEQQYISKVFEHGKLSAKGEYSKKCTALFREKWGLKHNLLTTSCTAALELSAIISEVGPGDEVILPSYTFVSTANAFILRGATVRFADSRKDHPNMDVDHVLSLINEKTRLIVVVHYAGMAVDMDPLMQAAKENNIIVVEDAAQAIDSYYKGRPLGGIGHFGAFSFHETKNITCGEGGMFTVNDEAYLKRSEIVYELGTNRSAFLRGEVDKYTWVDVGSSFLSSEILAGVLYAQLEQLEKVQKHRLTLWNQYYELLSTLEKSGRFQLPVVPEYATHNAHTFYLVMESERQRNSLIDHLAEQGIKAVFHYQALHKSPFYRKHNATVILPEAERYTNCLVRLPMYYDLTEEDVNQISESIQTWN